MLYLFLISLGLSVVATLLLDYAAHGILNEDRQFAAVQNPSPTPATFSKAGHCPNCNSRRSWQAFVPIFSFVLTARSCRHCQCLRHWTEVYAPLLFFVGLATMAVVYTMILEDSLYLWWNFALLWCGLLTFALLDLQFMAVDGKITTLYLSLKLLFIVLVTREQAWHKGVSFLVAVGMFYTLLFVYQAVRNREGLGEADPIILGFIAFFVDLQGLPFVILFSALSGVFFGGVSLILARKSLSQTPVPFIPFLALAGLCYQLLHDFGLLKHYTSLFPYLG